MLLDRASSDIASFPATGAVSLTAAGLRLGQKTLLVRFETNSRRLAIDADFPRCSALLSVAGRRPMPSSLAGHLEAAASFWQRGDPALANLRLVFAGLPRLDNADDVARVRAAEHLLDEGYDPAALLKELGFNTSAEKLTKYDPNQPRVPAGQGDKSGEWTIWSRVADWLAAPVPVYDQDTGIEVGQQPRGQAIAFSPVTVGVAGAAIVFGAEAAVEALGLGLTPYARQYLRGAGGPHGNAATRRQLYDIAQELVRSKQFNKFEGDGMGKEEWISPPSGWRKGGTFVDLTARRADGSAVRIQTIDTLADGVTPTLQEAAAANRIRTAFPKDELKLIPKVK